MRKFAIKILETLLNKLRPPLLVQPVKPESRIQVIELQCINNNIVCAEADAIEAEFAELILGLDLLAPEYSSTRLMN